MSDIAAMALDEIGPWIWWVGALGAFAVEIVTARGIAFRIAVALLLAGAPALLHVGEGYPAASIGIFISSAVGMLAVQRFAGWGVQGRSGDR
ncbi:hypothetical protein [Pararhizobium haloflavum]|uniref:hypothetical protein n=1 Tax=Pararhizobium haloflavum TaxID=2037914 RepID=UPI000C182BAE|nr:hypothetical protein [Pararhizobium haloflavum]